MNKNQWRHRIRQELADRSSLSDQRDQSDQRDHADRNHHNDHSELLKLPNKQDLLNERLCRILNDQSGVWAAFQPIHSEPDIRPALEKLSRIEWVFPRVEGEDLAFFRPQDARSLVVNRWGIREPDPAQSLRVNVRDLQGLLIPGLAFDLFCHRLGRGKGYYDRALAELHSSNNNAKLKVTKVIKIGIAFDQQIVDSELPTDLHDVPMDGVLTESRFFARENDAKAGVSSPGFAEWADKLSERKRS
jgi:5,10-methenyltetrahydrofolate synthetase